MKIHCLQHVDFEGPGMIAAWAEARGHEITSVPLYQQAGLPDPDDVEMLVVMGGPMGVEDEAAYPWLAGEKRCINTVIRQSKPVLGICLGAQLIARVLGAQVAPGPELEIGWFPIALRDEAIGHPLTTGLNTTLTVLHWHRDRFTWPAGALPLASSQACEQQGFLYGDHVLALQFHLEMEATGVEHILSACADDLTREGGPWVQDADTILDRSRQVHTRESLFTLLDNWQQHSGAF